MHFKENGRPEAERMKTLGPVKPDMIVYATGYRQEFGFFDEANKNGEDYPTCSDADVRCIWRHNDPTVGFIGFIRPGYGAIPPLAELQAQLWLMTLIKPEVAKSLSSREEYHFKLHGHKRIDYGVHHESYAYQLALDMDAVPSFWDGVRVGWNAGAKHPGLWWRLPVLWLTGAQFNTKFRVVGPYQWDGAVDVLGGELWETITRREGLFGKTFTCFMMNGILMILRRLCYDDRSHDYGWYEQHHHVVRWIVYGAAECNWKLCQGHLLESCVKYIFRYLFATYLPLK